jgi:parvulin-like peptidyl-prolyl isomerase
MEVFVIMLRRFVPAVAIVLSLFLTTSCKAPGDSLPEDVVATLDGEAIKVDAFRTFCGGTVPEAHQSKKDTLSLLVSDMLILKLAREKGYLSAPEIASRAGKEKQKYLVGAMLKFIADGVEVALDELEPLPAGLGPKLDLYVILTPTLEEARAARKRLEGGDDFQKVAREMSTGPSSVAGGHIGQVALSSTIYGQGVRAMLNAIDIGEISPIAELQTGFAIFKVAGRLDPAEVAEEVQLNQLKKLRTNRIYEAQARFKQQLRDQNDVVYNMEYGTPGGDNSWIAMLNGDKITLDIPELTEAEAMHLPHAMLDDEQTKEALEKEIDNILLANAARELGLDMTPEYLAVSWKAELESVAHYYIEKEVWPGSEVSDAEMQEYYDSNPDEFELLPKVELRRILVDDKGLAQDLRDMLDAGADFSHLAMQHSQDKTASKGGYAGEVYKGRAIEPINTVAFELEPGEYSDVLETKFGFEIIQILKKREGGPAPFESIRSELKKRLETEKRGLKVQKFYKEIGEGHELIVNEKLMMELKG